MTLARGAQKAVDAVMAEALGKDGKARSKQMTRTRSLELPQSPATTIRKLEKSSQTRLLKVGKDGVITVEEGRQVTTEVDSGRRDAVRSRLPFSSLRHQRR